MAVRRGPSKKARAQESRRPPKKNPLFAAKIEYVDYKDVNLLRTFISDRGKIRSRRVTGLTPRSSSVRLPSRSRTPARWRCFPTSAASRTALRRRPRPHPDGGAASSFPGTRLRTHPDHRPSQPGPPRIHQPPDGTPLLE